MCKDNKSINKTMDTKNIDEQPTKKPDETGSLLFESMIKISDPESGEILIEGRA